MNSNQIAPSGSANLNSQYIATATGLIDMSTVTNTAFLATTKTRVDLIDTYYESQDNTFVRVYKRTISSMVTNGLGYTAPDQVSVYKVVSKVESHSEPIFGIVVPAKSETYEFEN